MCHIENGAVIFQTARFFRKWQNGKLSICCFCTRALSARFVHRPWKSDRILRLCCSTNASWLWRSSLMLHGCVSSFLSIITWLSSCAVWSASAPLVEPHFRRTWHVCTVPLSHTISNLSISEQFQFALHVVWQHLFRNKRRNYTVTRLLFCMS